MKGDLINMNNYTNDLIKIINIVDTQETKNIKKAANIIFDSLKDDGVLHVFATGHSHMIAEEMFYRAGGLVPIDPILKPFLMQHEGAVSSTKYERLSGVAKVIFDGLDLKENEPFLIASNSGINSVPIEMAKIVSENNHPVIVITSYEVSKTLESRDIDKKHLFDYADVIIDNHAPYGDGIIKSEYGPIGSVSSIIGNYIVQRLVLELIELYNKNNKIPPIYKSANTTGGDEHNKKLFKQFQKRIKSLY